MAKGERGQIVDVWFKDDDRNLAASSLAAWLGVHLDALEAADIAKGDDGDWLWTTSAARKAHFERARMTRTNEKEKRRPRVWTASLI